MLLYLTYGTQRKSERILTLIFSVTDTELTRKDITDPVLYVALYSIGEEPSEVDDFHWVFIVGPSHEEADSEGTLFNMEPRETLDYSHSHPSEWRWFYDQPTIPLRGQHDLLARLMIAEVADMDMLQAIMMSWGGNINMREHPEWVSVKWVKSVLKSLDEERGCLGRRMESFEAVEAEVTTSHSNCIIIDGANGIATLSISRTYHSPYPHPKPRQILSLSCKLKTFLERKS